MICLTFLSCDTDESLTSTGNSKKKTVRFALSIPDYKVPVQKTRSTSYENAVNDLWLMIFDATGLFLERVHATNLVSEENGGIGSGSFEAVIPSNASIIHFIANCSQMESFDDMTAYRKDEREIIPPLISDVMAFWGRNVITSADNTINVVLYRNQAKITVENQGATNFNLTGYAICNYITAGTVAPFKDQLSNPFVITDDLPTIPQGTLSKASQNESDCDLTAKFIFANPNYYNDQTYVIIKGTLDNSTTELYYKIQLLDQNKQPYPVLRNTNYRIVIQSFSSNADGSAGFDGAMNSAPSNNIYADIFKDSPTISDNDNNVLTIGSVNLLFVQGGTLNLSAVYTQNGTVNNSEVSVSVAEDQGSILSGLTYDSTTGMITANVAQVLVGQQQATITVRAGILSRSITIISSALYNFTPVSFTPAFYTGKDQAVALNFNIPSSIPSYLYPLECAITTANLYPVAPNQDMEIRYTDAGFQYIYWVNGPGEVNLNFKTAFDNSDETVTIENKYFVTGSIPLQARHFINVSVNSGTNLVNYGQGETAAYSFTLSDIAGNQTTYPLTVFIQTDKLVTSQSGWTAVSGGYTHVFTSAPSGAQTVSFTSSTAASAGQVIISADGFSPTTISYDNVLTQNVSVTNTISVYTGGQYYDIPRFGISSNNTSVVSNFNASTVSRYSFSIKSGARLSDTVTFTTRSYHASYTVQQLLEAPPIILQ